MDGDAVKVLCHNGVELPRSPEFSREIQIGSPGALAERCAIEHVTHLLSSSWNGRGTQLKRKSPGARRPGGMLPGQERSGWFSRAGRQQRAFCKQQTKAHGK